MSTGERRQALEFLTPTLLAGAYRERPEWRGASLHGQLHFWARVLAFGSGDPTVMRRGEARLTGGLLRANGKLEPWAGPFAVWIEGEVDAEPPNFPGCPHDARKGTRRGLATDLPACLCWTRRASRAWQATDNAANETLERDFARLLRTWILLGGLGLRANRAAGSVWVPGWSPTAEEFRQHVVKLGLPPRVEVRLLPTRSRDELERSARSRLPREREYLLEAGPAEQLRAIATDTVKGAISGDPLGYAGESQDRKASPLKLKVGRFADGFRLIAVHDNRHGRGGQLGDAIDALRGKELGKLLAAAETIVTAPIDNGSAPAGGDADEVTRLLAGKFEYAAFDRYRRAVQQWFQQGRLEWVARFVEVTQAKQYAGLRQQPWYVEAVAKLPASPAAPSPP